MTFRVERDTLTTALEGLDQRVRSGIELGLRYGEDLAVQHARSNAPWTDRTGNARSGLSAISESSGNQFRLILFHRMPYGIYLETRWSGRFAIIMPTLRAIRGDLQRSIAAAIQRAVGG